MFQEIVLVGNLGRDPELRYTPAGTSVCNLSLATNRRWKTAEGADREEVAWFRISVWGKQGEACNAHLRKGRQVLVKGRLVADENGNPRIWTGQDGSPRASFEVNAETVRFLGSKPQNGDQAEDHPAETEQEEIPF